jgi:RPA family protein
MSGTPKTKLIDVQPGQRARIMGTIVNTYVTSDNNYGFFVVDDNTETIRVKVFNGARMIKRMRVGQLVDIFGTVEEYKGEVYIKPELVKRVKDPNLYLLRMVELLGTQKPAGEKVLKILQESKDEDGVGMEELEKLSGLDRSAIQELLAQLMLKGAVYEPTKGCFKITGGENGQG